MSSPGGLATLRRFRRRLYRLAALLGDVNAVASGQIPRRAARKLAYRRTSGALRRLLR